MSGTAAGLLLLIVASSPPPSVVFFRQSPAPPSSPGDELLAARRRLFDREVERASRPIFEERGWRFASTRAPPECVIPSCFDRAARGRAATHWLRSRVEPSAPTGCRIRLELHVDPEDVRHRAATLDRCEADELLTRATSWARGLASGPRWVPPIDSNLASSWIADLDVPEISDLRSLEWTESSTIAERTLPLDRALKRYRAEAIVIFRDPPGGLRFARDGRLLGECGLRRAAGAPLDREQRVFCRGNAWAWSLVGVPAGALLTLASFPELEAGNLQGFVGVGLGVLSAAAAAVLGLTQMEMGHDPEDGIYLSPPAELRRLARDRNRRLRVELGLTAADVRLLEVVDGGGSGDR